MNNLLRITSLAILLVSALALSACTNIQRVTFASHAPYNSPVTYGSPLLIIFPEDNDQATSDYDYKAGPATDRFVVEHGNALKHETAARLQRMFTEIAIVDQGVYDEMMIAHDDDERTTSTATALAGAPLFVLDDVGYLLVFDDIHFEVAENRALYVFNVTMTDRYTGDVVLRGQMTGRSEAIQGAPNTKRVSEATLSAAGVALTKLSRMMRDSIDKS